MFRASLSLFLLLALAWAAFAEHSSDTLLVALLSSEKARTETDLRKAREQEDRARHLLDEAIGAEVAATTSEERLKAQELFEKADAAVVKWRALVSYHQDWLRRVERMIEEASKENPPLVVMDLQGAIERRSEGHWQSYDGHKKLQAGDSLRTGPDGFVQAFVTDGGKLTVGADSEVKFRELRPERATYDIWKGRIHLLWRILKDPAGYRYEREKKANLCWRGACSGAPLGTEVEFQVLADDSCQITVLEGAIEWRDPATGRTVRAGAGSQIRLRKGRKPEGPVGVDLNRFPRWWETPPPRDSRTAETGSGRNP